MSSSEDDGLGSSGEVFIPHLGWMRFPPPDLVLQHLREGTFEFREQAFVWSFLKPADTFLDVGAHCGLFAKIGTNIISPRGRIVAVEPNDDVLRFLRANLYGCAVDIRPIAITNEIGEASLWKEQDSDAALSSLAYSSPTGIRTTVQTTTLDQLLHDEDIAEVAFVKLDVEGSELAVLKGARSALDRKSILALLVEFTEENLRKVGSSAPQLANELISNGYHPYKLSSDGVQLDPVTIDGPVTYQNIVFTHDFDAVQRRLGSAPLEYRRIASEILTRGRASEAVENEATARLELLLMEKRETERLRLELQKRAEDGACFNPSTSSPKATLFTSLPPRTNRSVAGIDYSSSYQSACVDSWRAAGLGIQSINPRSEIEKLQALGISVTYILSEHDRPSINEFLQASLRAPTEIVAIINADCIMLNVPDLIQNVLSAAAHGLVMAERVNISNVNLQPTSQTCLGFDAFFFNKKIVAAIDIDDRLKVGQPWWDYWLPVEFALQDVELFRLPAPLIFHLDHEQGWSQERWLDSGINLLNRLGAGNQRLDVERFLRPEILERSDLGGFGDWIFDWLRENSQLIDDVETGTFAHLQTEFLKMLSNFDGMHCATRALAEARNEVSRLSALASANLVEELSNLRQAHASAEIYAHHLEEKLAQAAGLSEEIYALRQAHASAETYAHHLEEKLAHLEGRLERSASGTLRSRSSNLAKRVLRQARAWKANY